LAQTWELITTKLNTCGAKWVLFEKISSKIRLFCAAGIGMIACGEFVNVGVMGLRLTRVTNTTKQDLTKLSV
jgi:hypothetical protein